MLISSRHICIRSFCGGRILIHNFKRRLISKVSSNLMSFLSSDAYRIHAFFPFFSADFIDDTNSSKAKKASRKVDDSTERVRS